MVSAKLIFSVLRLASPKLFPRDVFHRLRRYTGPNAFGVVLRPWVDDCGGWLGDLMAPLASYGGWRRDRYVFGDLLEQACALCRVSDVLLRDSANGADPPYVADCRPSVRRADTAD
jgi:hypothetical protein